MHDAFQFVTGCGNLRIGCREQVSWLAVNDEQLREMGVGIKWKGLDGNAHLVNAKVRRMVTISEIETFWNGFNDWNWDRSDLVKSLKHSHLAGSGGFLRCLAGADEGIFVGIESN